ncbi:MAG: N-acetylmuramoyl-L-alanine amidase [Proteobacteria bacterium]|nr:N-acetylmuramoyl-L-alanine amidase [Pseudomonadota bacterium]
MSSRSRQLAAVFILLILTLLPHGTVLADPSVTGARIGLHTNMTRFVLDLSESVDFDIFLLGAPYRVVIDLPAVEWALPNGRTAEGRGLVLRYRFGQFDRDTSRVVLDVGGPVTITNAFLVPPDNDKGHRLVVDLEEVSEVEFAGLLAQAAPKKVTRDAEPRSEPVAVTATPTGTHLVVIDPGHGGIDPGATSRSGIHEKDITLAAAFELKNIFEQTGRYRAALTRDRDIFVALRERVEIGRALGGDLFISLHADHHNDRTIRGASVYTLSEKASDQEAAKLAQRENKSDVIAGLDLSGSYDEEVTAILITLTQRETMNCAAVFATALVPELGKSGKLLVKPHRSAGFRILKAPDMPSILVELGYLSNTEDQRILGSPAGRANLLEGIRRAVDQYFNRDNCRTKQGHKP